VFSSPKNFSKIGKLCTLIVFFRLFLAADLTDAISWLVRLVWRLQCMIWLNYDDWFIGWVFLILETCQAILLDDLIIDDPIVVHYPAIFATFARQKPQQTLFFLFLPLFYSSLLLILFLSSRRFIFLVSLHDISCTRLFRYFHIIDFLIDLILHYFLGRIILQYLWL